MTFFRGTIAPLNKLIDQSQYNQHSCVSLLSLRKNAEQNEYPAGVEPLLEFIITSQDITGTGAPATPLVFSNEIAF